MKLVLQKTECCGDLKAGSAASGLGVARQISYKRFLEITLMDRFYKAPLAQRDRIRVRADGTFELVPNEALLTENPMVYTSMPAGEKASFGINLYAVLPEGPKLNYAELTGGVSQGNALIKAGPKILTAVALGVINHLWDEALAAENPLLQFSERPSEVEFDAI